MKKNWHDDSTMLPCPFCGSNGETLIDVAEETAYARCTSSQCRAYTGRKLLGTRADAVEHWNKRAGMEYRELARELAEALKRIAYTHQDLCYPPIMSEAEAMRSHAIAALAKYREQESRNVPGGKTDG